MQTLPVNYAGLALIIFAVVLFLLDIKLASHGLLAIGGIVSLLLGSIMLIRPGSDSDVVGISRVVIIVSTAITALFFLTIIGLGLKAQRGKPVTGTEGLIGEIGETLEALTPVGSIRVHGEHWKAESVAGNIELGRKVRVIRMKDWKLYVEQLISP
jgi:membrane-bound serine protease (ClpP class)